MITIPVNRCILNTINNQNELIKCELIFYEVFNNQKNKWLNELNLQIIVKWIIHSM